MGIWILACGVGALATGIYKKIKAKRMESTISFTRHLKACHAFDPKKFIPFRIAGQDLGWVTPDVADLLAQKQPKDFTRTENGLVLSDDLTDYKSRTAALTQATHLLCTFHNEKMRHENYGLIGAWGDTPLAEIDRCAVPWFGVRGFGVHVNGFVRKKGKLFIWLGERSAKQVYPGKLDNIIGGGLPIGLSIRQNLLKEAQEEAGFGPDIANSAKLVATMTYKVELMKGLRCDTLFVYDLELPEGVEPLNTDGEVAAFHLIPADEVAEIIRTTDRFKFNCNLVITDFLMRQGFFAKDHPEYARINEWIGKTREALPEREE